MKAPADVSDHDNEVPDTEPDRLLTVTVAEKETLSPQPAK